MKSMKHNHLPWPPEHPMTLELLDFYVAKARAERAKAMAEFGRQLAAAVSRIARRLVRRRLPRRQNPAGPAPLLTR